MTRRTRFKAFYHKDRNNLYVQSSIVSKYTALENKTIDKCSRNVIETQILQLLGVLNRHTRDHVLAILVTLQLVVKTQVHDS